MRYPALLLLAAVLANPPAAISQERATGVELRGGVALGIARTMMGDSSASDAGPLLVGQAGIVLSPRADFTVGVVLQPFHARSPLTDSSYTAIYTLVGAQVAFDQLYRVYLRPEVGLMFRSWSGGEVFGGSAMAPVAGAVLGGEIAIGNALGLAPELFVRVSGADDMRTMLWGVTINLVFLGARPKLS